MKHDIIYTSHIGVYGVIIDNNKILLIKKNRGAYRGLMDLPGGSIEAHESIDDALYREIKEETGANIINHEQLETFSIFYNYELNSKPHILKHIAIIYKVDIVHEKLIYNFKLEDSDGCIWIEINNIDNNNISPIVQKSLTII